MVYRFQLGNSYTYHFYVLDGRDRNTRHCRAKKKEELQNFQIRNQMENMIISGHTKSKRFKKRSIFFFGRWFGRLVTTRVSGQPNEILFSSWAFEQHGFSDERISWDLTLTVHRVYALFVLWWPWMMTEINYYKLIILNFFLFCFRLRTMIDLSMWIWLNFCVFKSSSRSSN